MTMSATEFLQWFETDPLIATMSASGIIGTSRASARPGTAYALLHHYMGEIDGAFRAWGSAGRHRLDLGVDRVQARAAGVDIRTEAPVARIDVRGAGHGRGAGVGRGDRRGTVLSSVDSHVTFLRLVEPSNLEPSFLQEVKRYKFRGSSGKVNLASTPCPSSRVGRGKGEAPRRDQLLAGCGLHGARVRRREVREFSTRPYIDCIIPTLVDLDGAAGQARDEGAQASTPRTTSTGATDDAERDAFGETVI